MGPLGIFTYFICGPVIFLIGIFRYLPKQHWIRYYVAYFNYLTLYSIMHFIALLAFLFGERKYSGAPWILEKMSPISSKLLDIEWEVRNVEYGKQVKQAVVVVNHQSIIDVLGLGNCMSIGPSVAISKKEVIYYFPVGLSFWLSGIIFIDRHSPKDAWKQITEASVELFSRCENIKIYCFPEGTRNEFGSAFLPFKSGAFRLAIDNQVPIIPLVFSPYTFIDDKKKIFTKGKMISSFLKPIMTKDLEPKDADMLLKKTKSLMEEEYNKLKNEFERTN